MEFSSQRATPVLMMSSAVSGGLGTVRCPAPPRGDDSAGPARAITGFTGDHLGRECATFGEHPGARDSANVRNGTRAKTVLTHASGQVELAVPRDREGTFEPVIVKKRARFFS